MTPLYVKPGEGRAVPDPEHGGELLPAEGRSVPNTAYWQRRLKDHDVIEAEPVPAASESASVEPKPAKRSAAQ